VKKYIFIFYKVQVMRSSLITLLLSSDKRTDLLLFLKEKPRTIEEINEALDTNSVAILPQLKRLKESELVIQENKTYSLSLLGKIIVRKMEPLVKAFRLLEDNYDYWTSSRPGTIPAGFFKQMEELVTYTPGRYHGDESSSRYSEMIKAFEGAKRLSLIISNSNPRYIKLCLAHAKKGSEISVIFTQPVFETFEAKFKKELEILLSAVNTEVYLLEKNIIPPTIAVTDTMALACFSPESSLDESNSIVSFGEEAVQWGMGLFDHFKNLATPFIPEPKKPQVTETGKDPEKAESEN
jgi:predicted transcriptional regulator